MDLPATLTRQLDNIAGSGADLSIGDANRIENHGFSKHFEKNVERLDSERAVSSSKAEKKPEKPDDIGALTGNNSVQKAGPLPKAMTDENVIVDQTFADTSGLPNGLEEKLDTALLGKAPGLSSAIGVVSDKRNLGINIISAGISGNELPSAADMDGVINNEQILNIGESDKEIVFDPLSQTKESSVQIAALTASHLPAEKTGLGGKNSEGDYFKSLGSPLPLDKLNQGQIFDAALERIQKTVPSTQTGATLAKEIGSVKVATGIDGSLSSLAALTHGSGQIEQISIDKPTLQLNTPMNSPNWGENFSQRVHWVVNQSISGAQIRLNPQHMGPIEVRIQMQNEQATVSFTAQHGATREAIDAALPRLREMFNEQNVNVVDIDVSQHSFAEQREQQASNNDEDTSAHLSEFDGEAEDSLFDQHDNGENRVYTGLFSDFA